MTLSEKIVQKYPIAASFATSAPQSLCIYYDASISDAFRHALEKTLREDMSVHLEQEDGFRVIKAQISTVQIGGAPLLCLESKHAQFYFDPKRALGEMPWILRGLADKASWLISCAGKVVTVRTYSARQQTLALQFIRECQHQLEVGGDISTPSNRIREVIREVTARRLDDRLPEFSDRPISEEGWELICESNNLLRRGERMSLEELSKTLYGSLDLEQEVEDWIDFFCQLPSFAEELKRAKVKICTTIRDDCRLADGDRVFAHVRGLMNAEMTGTSEDDMEKVFRAFEQDVTVRRLRPDTLPVLFSDATHRMNQVMKLRMEEKASQQLLDECESVMKKELSASRSKLQQYHRELHALCPMKGINMEPDDVYTWQQLSDIGDNLLQTTIPGWNAQHFNDLSMNVPDRQYLKAWLMNRGLQQQMATTHGSGIIQVADLSSGDIVAAVYGEPLPDA